MHLIKAGEYIVLANGSVSFFDSTKPITITLKGLGDKDFVADFFAKKTDMQKNVSKIAPVARFVQSNHLEIDVPVDKGRGEGSTEEPVDLGQVYDYFLYLQFKISVSGSGHLLLFYTFYGKPIK